MPTVFLSTTGLLGAAAQARTAADDADDLRRRLLTWLPSVGLDDPAAVARMTRVDEVMGLLAGVLDARAGLAAYTIAGPVAVALAQDVRQAELALLQFLGPNPTRVADGQRAAEELRAAYGRPDPALLAVLRAGAGDPSFALGLTTALGIDGAGLALARSSNANPGSLSAGAEEIDAWIAGHRELLDVLGSLYALASHGTGAFAGPATDADAWIAAITVEPLDSEHTAQGQAAALLLAGHDLPPDVLRAVADGVYTYELTASQGSMPLWFPRADSSGVYVGPLDRDMQQVYDPLDSILHALARQPDVAQAFFTAGDVTVRSIEGGDRRFNERLVYLLEDRRWPDDGAALGEALVAATTFHRDAADAGRTSAELASQTIALVAESTGDGDGWFDAGWQAPTALRPALATILVDYMPDVFHIVSAPAFTPGDPGAWFAASPPGFPPHGPYGLAVTSTMLETVVGTIGTNPDDARRLLASVLGTQQLRTAFAIDQLRLGDPDLAAHFLFDGGPELTTEVPLQNATIEGSTALGFIVNHAFQGDRADQADQAEAQRMWADLVGTALALPVLPSPAGPWGKLVLSQATKRIMTAWAGSVPSDATSIYGSIDEEVRLQMEALVLNQLAAEGLLHPGVEVPGYEPPPDTAFVLDRTGQPAQPLRFDPESDTYQEWYALYAPRPWVLSQVVLPYMAAFPNVG